MVDASGFAIVPRIVRAVQHLERHMNSPTQERMLRALKSGLPAEELATPQKTIAAMARSMKTTSSATVLLRDCMLAFGGGLNVNQGFRLAIEQFEKTLAKHWHAEKPREGGIWYVIKAVAKAVESGDDPLEAAWSVTDKNLNLENGARGMILLVEGFIGRKQEDKKVPLNKVVDTASIQPTMEFLEWIETPRKRILVVRTNKGIELWGRFLYLIFKENTRHYKTEMKAIRFETIEEARQYAERFK